MPKYLVMYATLTGADRITYAINGDATVSLFFWRGEEIASVVTLSVPQLEVLVDHGNHILRMAAEAEAAVGESPLPAGEDSYVDLGRCGG